VIYQDKEKHEVGGVFLVSQGRRTARAPRKPMAVTSEAKISRLSRKAFKPRQANQGFATGTSSVRQLVVGTLLELSSCRAHFVGGANPTAL
jgi:hypothetical protein